MAGRLRSEVNWTAVPRVAPMVPEIAGAAERDAPGGAEKPVTKSDRRFKGDSKAKERRSNGERRANERRMTSMRSANGKLTRGRAASEADMKSI
jgi:hypothetical protein